MNKESVNQDTQSSKVSEVDATPMVGDILRAKRESLGLSQKEIADRLRLRIAIIQSIDANDFQVGQVHTFTRGYIRSYAKVVGVDDKLMLELFDSSEFGMPPEQAMQSFSQQTKKEKHDSHIMKITWGILAIVVGISALWWWQSEQNTASVISDVVEQESVVNERVMNEQAPIDTDELVAENQTIEPASTITADQLQLDPESVDGELQPNPVSSDEVVEAVDPEILVPEVVKAPTPAVAMTFSGDCWIQVQDANGKTLWTGVKTSGQTLQLEGQAPYKFVLGAPEVVSLSISGEPVDLSRYTAGKVARFTAE